MALTNEQINERVERLVGKPKTSDYFVMGIEQSAIKMGFSPAVIQFIKTEFTEIEQRIGKELFLLLLNIGYADGVFSMMKAMEELEKERRDQMKEKEK